MSNLTFLPQSKPGSSYRVVQVLVDGESIGFVVGRSERSGGPRWWDHYSEDVNSFPMRETCRFVYPSRNRQQAVENLLFTVAHKQS